MNKTKQQKELARLIKAMIRKKRIFHISASNLFNRLNGYGFFHHQTSYRHEIKYSGVAISRALKNLEKKGLIKTYNQTRTGNKTYEVIKVESRSRY